MLVFFHFKSLHFFHFFFLGGVNGGRGAIHGARLGLHWLGDGDLVNYEPTGHCPLNCGRTARPVMC